MKLADLRKQAPKDLEKTLVTTREELLASRRALAAGELVNPRVITNGRKTIARIQTLLNQATNEPSTKKEDA